MNEQSAHEPTERESAINELLRGVCLALQWSVDRSGTPAERVAKAIAHFQLHIDMDGVAMSVALSEDLQVCVEVHLEDQLTEDHESALRAALIQCDSPVARLVLAEWRVFVGTCRQSVTARR